MKLNVHVENKFKELHGVNLILCFKAIVATLSIFVCHPFLGQCLLTPINNEMYEKQLIFIIYIVIGS